MNRSFNFKQGRSRAMLAGVCSIFFAAAVSAQVTSVRLPTADSTASFRVLDNAGVVKLRVNGDGGFYAGGSINVGAIPASGAGTRMMWFPGREAFRAGYVTGTQWDSANVGQFSVAMGYNSTASGVASTAMGHTTTASADGSTAMGGYVSTDIWAGAFIIGDRSTTTTTNSISPNQMTMRFAGGYRLFTNSAANVGVGMAAGGNSWAAISDSTKKTGFKKADHDYFLKSLSRLRLGSWNYKSQDAKHFRHYGPMAQEIYHYFGNDGRGTIGCDTLLATADMDGIMMICLQALEKRTGELNAVVDKLKAERAKVAQLQSSFDEMKAEMASMKIELRSLAAAGTGTAQEKIALNTISKGQ